MNNKRDNFLYKLIETKNFTFVNTKTIIYKIKHI